MLSAFGRTYALIKNHMSKKTMGMLFAMSSSRTFILFGIGMITVPALFMLFYNAALNRDALRFSAGVFILLFYVIWLIWGDKNQMMRYNRAFFKSQIGIQKSYVQKLINIPFGAWREKYNIGKATTLIDDGAGEIMMRFQDIVKIVFKGCAVLAIGVFVFFMSNIFVTAAVFFVIGFEFLLSRKINERISPHEKNMFDIKAKHENDLRCFVENADIYTMRGFANYWKEKVNKNIGQRYDEKKKIINLGKCVSAVNQGMDLVMYILIIAVGTGINSDMIAPLVLIMAYDMIKDVVSDFMESALRIRQKIYAVDEFEAVDSLTNDNAEEPEKSDGGIEVRNVSVEIEGKKILSNVNLKIEKGSKTLIVGKNGTGKTLFVKTLLGIMEPSEGTVKFGGIDMSDLNSAARARITAYNPVERAFFPISVTDNLNMFCENDAYDGRSAANELNRIIKRKVDVSEEISDAENEFSLGEQDVICFLRTMAADADIAVLDEPLAHADKKIFAAMYEAAMKSDKTVIIIEHEFEKIAAKYDPFIIWMDSGGVKAHGKYSELCWNCDFA